ncbi:formin-binding protein 4-like [Phymastichus coffea]|uniref:formin-binding protein 4-like n=1 Tax=Phymastichus coffea TaxID=108790 RepID=UPI00273BB362|nr:formin-binding protein 4-like [Phymastichus coffea]
MKRRHRKPVLDINGESDSSRGRWPSERQSQNGSPSNPLSNLITQYNSDSEGDYESKPRAHKLNDQVNDFLKEIQSIAPENSDKSNQGSIMSHPSSFWQECYDEQTGYPYYWHTETNQVTWEIPTELKAIKEKGTAAPHGSHVPQWSNIPANKFSSSNIPDGMIPKEVVQRNRNRQAGIKTIPEKPSSKPNITKSPGFKMSDDDEGKIEMITSFGNDESESEESEQEEKQKKQAPMPRKSALKASKPADVPSKPREPNITIGQALPPVHYGPQNRESLSEKLAQNVNREKKTSSVMSSSEEDILTRLKNQAKLLQKQNSKVENESSTSNDKDDSQKDVKMSLVPGYDDDSEGEEDTRKSSTIKPLFPIAETSHSHNSNSGKVAKNIETNTGKIRIYEYKNSESNDDEEKNDEDTKSNEATGDKPEDEKIDLESKANKFLESIDAPSKAFQRKKRIAFDVAPTKNKAPESTRTKEDSPPVHMTDGVERRGFGFSKENSPDEENSKIDSETTSKKPMGITFIKSSAPTEDTNYNNSNSVAKTKEITEADKIAMREQTGPIMEKLKFLSEGSPAASAVQIMAIQIQTLLAAWESGSLSESYLRNWLTGTGCELTRLEQTAAPPGWECQWDRSHKRYYYRNTSTGEAQWTYPQTGIAGGAEEMELCTTPPPPEHEEPPIIEMSAQTTTMSNDSCKPENNVDPQSKQEPPTEAPPPPTISGPPSPPPPPRINAEDLKRGRKRKGSPDVDGSTSKGLHSHPILPITNTWQPNEVSLAEVEPAEIAYTLPTSALEAGVLYGAQQTNPIYAATLAGAAGIPLLSHPHTALMQGQLMHYTPAYHQHLHNQALVARLSGQEAVAQFMVAEYARVYDQNNQVIAKPPVKMPHEASLGSALNSFYSDIASMEKSNAVAEAAEKERLQAEHMRLTTDIQQQPVMMQAVSMEGEVTETKEKKKKKLKTGIGKKQKEMSSMVAKWQRAQLNYKEGH